jgi:hypothetical protein
MANPNNCDRRATRRSEKLRTISQQILLVRHRRQRWGDAAMTLEHVRYLQEKAKQLRLAAGGDRSELARQLRALADEFDAKAAEIEASAPRNSKLC